MQAIPVNRTATVNITRIELLPSHLTALFIDVFFFLAGTFVVLSPAGIRSAPAFATATTSKDPP